MTARLNGLRYFLTYAQVNDANLNCDTFADALFSLDPVPLFVEVCQEYHQDDGIHYHAVVVFRNRVQKPIATFFNVSGYHPNVRPIKNGGADLYYRRHYLRKEEKGPHDTKHRDEPCDYTGVPTERGDPPPYSTVDTAGCDDWGTIVEQSGSRQEFLDRIRSKYPKDFVLKYDAIEHYAQRFYSAPTQFVPKYPRETFTVPAVMDEWVTGVFSEVCLLCSGTFARTSLRLLILAKYDYYNWLGTPGPHESTYLGRTH